MPSRQIVVDGRAWRVYPSGFLTSSIGDEFSLIFVAGDANDREVRLTRYTPQHARAREQALAEMTNDDLTRLFLHVAVERTGTGNRLPRVTTDSPAQTNDGSIAASSATPRFVDLQVHTTASDGVLSPTAVVEAAARVKLTAISITDHDSISGLVEAEAAGDRLGVRIVPGVELAAHFDGDELHLLGLHLSNRDAIEADLRAFRTERIERAEEMVRVLNSFSIPVTMESVLREAGVGAVGRPHLARAMVAGGWVRDFREAFDKWLGWGKPAYVEKGQLTVPDACALIHRAGGLSVWAHPADLATETRLRKLHAVGLDAVEVLHPSHPQPLAERIYDRAERIGLLPSGGSDWHGAADGPRQLGGQLVPYLWLARQDRFIAERAG